MMNKDQVNGATKKLMGKVQQQTGKLIGSKRLEVKGFLRHFSGKMQESIGDARHYVDSLKKN